MLGIIVKITDPRTSKNGSGLHQWVFFKDMLSGDCIPMCLPHSDDALRRWEGALSTGNVLDDLNVILRGRNLYVDVHSRPRLVTHLEKGKKAA